MKIEKIHLQILLPVLSMLKIQSCEISTNCFGENVIISDDFKLGYISMDDFGNFKGHVEGITFSTQKDHWGKLNIFIDGKKISCQEDDCGSCVVSLEFHHIFLKKNSFGQYCGYMNRKNFILKRDDFGHDKIEIYDSFN